MNPAEGAQKQQQQEADPCVRAGGSPTGYLHPAYAASLGEFGQPIGLEESRGWLLRRQIPGTDLYDAMGSYPLFCCAHWDGLQKDLGLLERRLVSLAMITDPFGNFDVQQLGACLDLVVRFKEHYICDLEESPDRFVTRHHRYYARRALKDATVEVVDTPLAYLDEWCQLYGILCKRHGLTGLKAFSKEAFARQFEIPGLVMLRMTTHGLCNGMQLWFLHNRVAYSHLTALSEAGYANRTSYGLYWGAIQIFKESFAPKVRWMDLGAGAGLSANGTDGLSLFKKDWSTETRPVWFCGRILDRDSYASLVKERTLSQDPYFPLYRKGEFT